MLDLYTDYRVVTQKGHYFPVGTIVQPIYGPEMKHSSVCECKVEVYYCEAKVIPDGLDDDVCSLVGLKQWIETKHLEKVGCPYGRCKYGSFMSSSHPCKKGCKHINEVK